MERDPFPSQIKRLYQNFEILGIPIGDAQFCSKYVRDKCSFSAFRAIDAITTLDDPQVTQMLLRLCASYCKIVHFLRGVPCSFIKNTLQEFDDAVRVGLERCVGIPIPDNKWFQASLSLSKGGFGLRRSGHHASAAYLASVSYAALEDGWSMSEANGWQEAIHDYNSRVSEIDEVQAGITTAWKQRLLSQCIEQNTFDHILQEASIDDRARLWAVSGPNASAWLTVIPSVELKQALSRQEFAILAKWWLGLDIYIYLVPSVHFVSVQWIARAIIH